MVPARSAALFAMLVGTALLVGVLYVPRSFPLYQWVAVTVLPLGGLAVGYAYARSGPPRWAPVVLNALAYSAAPALLFIYFAWRNSESADSTILVFFPFMAVPALLGVWVGRLRRGKAG